MTLILIGLGSGGCSLSRPDSYAKMNAADVTGSLGKQAATAPTESARREIDGIIHYCVANMPAAYARTATANRERCYFS